MINNNEDFENLTILASFAKIAIKSGTAKKTKPYLKQAIKWARQEQDIYLKSNKVPSEILEFYGLNYKEN